jgi:hypothetical protein
MNTPFRTILCSALIVGIVSSTCSAQYSRPSFKSDSNAAEFRRRSHRQGISFEKAAWITGITATLVAVAGYTAYRMYKNRTIEGKIKTAYNTLTDISKDTFVANITAQENDDNLAVQATQRFAKSQFPLILAQNYLVAQAGQLAAADRCLTEARNAIKKSVENEKTTEQEKDRLNKLDDTCRQIKKHITAYTTLIEKKLTALLDMDGYEMQLALYAQADAIHRNGWWQGANLITYSLLAVIGMVIVIGATMKISDAVTDSIHQELQNFIQQMAQPPAAPAHR